VEKILLYDIKNKKLHSKVEKCDYEITHSNINGNWELLKSPIQKNNKWCINYYVITILPNSYNSITIGGKKSNKKKSKKKNPKKKSVKKSKKKPKKRPV